MAYAIKYKLSFDAFQHNGDDTNTTIAWIANIYVEGWGGGATELSGGSADPISIKMPDFDDVFEPICASQATISIMATSNDQFVEFQTMDTYGAYVDITKDGTTFWRGVIVTEPYVEPFRAAPYPVTLTFSDGLAELQYERFENSGTLRTGFTSLIAIMTKCFSFLPFTRKTRELINIFEDTLNDGDTRGLLEQVNIKEDAFWESDHDDEIHGENCLEVLRGIMSSLKCRLIVSNDIWYVIRIGEMFDTTIKYVEYDVAGAVDTNSTIDLRQAIDKTATGTSLLRHLAGGNNTISREYQEVRFHYSSKNITSADNNVLVNGNFEHGYDLQNSQPVPKYWTRSAAVNTQMGVDANGLRLGQWIKSTQFNPQKALILEESMLAKARSGATFEKAVNQNLAGVDNNTMDTAETYNLFAESPADSSVTFKNLIHSTSDYLEIRIRGAFKYKYRDHTQDSNSHPRILFKWILQQGANYYNTGDKTWSTDVDSRVWHIEDGDPNTDKFYNNTGTAYRVHFFDENIKIKAFASNDTSDLKFTWHIPDSLLGLNLSNGTSSISEITWLQLVEMELKYVSNASTEFEIQKVLGETGSATLRRKAYDATVKHSDGPSNFSLMSFRESTGNAATQTWSTRGNSEALPGYKILVIDPIFENLGTLRQVFSGPLYGFLELHNTVSGIDSKVYALKGYDFRLKSNIINVKLHEVGTLSPSITYKPLVSLPTFTAPDDSDEGDTPTEANVKDNLSTTTQTIDEANAEEVSVTETAVVKTMYDGSATADDYPV